MTIPLKALEKSEPLQQQQYWMSQINEHFVSFTRKEPFTTTTTTDDPLLRAMDRFPKHFPSVGFLAKWGKGKGDNRTMHLFEQQTRRVHIIGDPGTALLQACKNDGEQHCHQDVPLLSSKSYSAYFRCQSIFEHVLAICTSPYGILLIGLAFLLFCASLYTCYGNCRQQQQGKKARINAGSVLKSLGVASQSEKSMIIELQFASSALASSASSSSSSSSVSSSKTTSTAGHQEKTGAIKKNKKI